MIKIICFLLKLILNLDGEKHKTSSIKGKYRMLKSFYLFFYLSIYILHFCFPAEDVRKLTFFSSFLKNNGDTY